MKSVQVQYFAVFREQRGLSREAVTTTSVTARDLYHELATEHGFTLDEKLVKAALNGRFTDMDEELRDGDNLVFIPPVAGG